MEDVPPGHHPILMDFGLIGGVNPPDPKAGGPMSFADVRACPVRDGRHVCDTPNGCGLIEMEPRNDLSSTGYVLANPGVEYLALQTEPAATFTVTLEPGTYTMEWFDVDERGTVPADEVTAEEAGPMRFQSPVTGGPSVAYLKAV